MKYQGYEIRLDCEGYYWSRGGYFDTIEECKKDIDFALADDEEYRIVPEDTPQLDLPWWMNA